MTCLATSTMPSSSRPAPLSTARSTIGATTLDSGTKSLTAFAVGEKSSVQPLTFLLALTRALTRFALRVAALEPRFSVARALRSSSTRMSAM